MVVCTEAPFEASPDRGDGLRRGRGRLECGLELELSAARLEIVGEAEVPAQLRPRLVGGEPWRSRRGADMTVGIPEEERAVVGEILDRRALHAGRLEAPVPGRQFG